MLLLLIYKLCANSRAQVVIKENDPAPQSGIFQFSEVSHRADENDASVTIEVALIDNDSFKGDETFVMTLSNVQGGAVLGTPEGALITINENDPKPDDSTDLNDGVAGTSAVHSLYLIFLMVYFVSFSHRMRKQK